MFRWLTGNKLTPLHRAVIAGDEAGVKKLAGNPMYCEVSDTLGFSALELAQLLGQQECQKLLLGAAPAKIRLKLKDSLTISEISVTEFERLFNLTYRPFLTFSSYHILREAINNCPYLLRCTCLVSENYALAKRYHLELALGALADLSVRWINDELGYGVFAESDIPEGTFIGEYTGHVRRLYRRHPDHNAYCFRYPTKLWSWHYFIIDAMKESNLLRFINHSDRPNLQPLCAVDRGLLHQIFISNQPIHKDAQLTFDYGQDYWIRRHKIRQ